MVALMESGLDQVLSALQFISSRAPISSLRSCWQRLFVLMSAAVEIELIQ